MNRFAWLLPLMLLVAGVTGCGKSDATPPTLEAPTQSTSLPGGAAVAAYEPKQVAVDATPDQVVSVFLEAMRAADGVSVETLLTTQAREETKRHNMPVEPVAAPHAQFQVAAPQYLPMNPNGAHVQAQWAESDGMTTYTHTVIWVLRRQAEGWRIAGFAIELVPGQGPQFLNFEDPADMLKKQQEAVAAIQAAGESAAQQASQPPQLAPGGPTQFK
ncbi:hypothetical protein [Anatilimnocola floriformis]|uniref:hypothetical protein n=1 Tax=Anatilimnocola floriformis TaxID=2948575 RepID=UPI0020C43C0A|nr:hypothetical protein [Anatilimnocola floriformis]